MVTGDGYGKSLFSCLSLSFSFWGMVAEDGYGKCLGDGYGRWPREVFVFLFFLIFLLSGGWLREMVTGSLCFPFYLDISPCGRWLRDVFVFLCGKLLLVKTCRRFQAGFPAVSLSEDCVPPRVGDG